MCARRSPTPMPPENLLDKTAAADDPGEPVADITTCYRHPRRETYVRCARCDRPVCPDCMKEAAVGFHCPECLREGSRTVRQARTVFGGRVVTNTFATYALIALNVVAYLVELVYPSVVDRFDSLGIALLGPDGQYYVADGGAYPGFEPVGIAYGEWDRLITSAFLHLQPTDGGFGILHILLNMYWLWVLGRILEERLGHARLVAVYLVSALGGSVLGFLISPDQGAVGASGAIFGLAACYFVITRRLHEHPIDRNRLIVMFVLWLVLSAGFTSWEGHLGGLLAGGAVAVGLAYAPQHRRVAAHVATTTAMTVLLLGLVVLKSLQLTGSI
ncbi:rhomboid family intramembrane serine protease [Asanoa sp. NPDC050611]|uniref:rhomboid family intramembrane serine protease n=1 Tax=Asanoa sp. NPDC050611 TaxID=3157098 RepID=UPI0033D34BEB